MHRFYWISGYCGIWHERNCPLNWLHSVVSQKIELFIATDVRTSDTTEFYFVHQYFLLLHIGSYICAVFILLALTASFCVICIIQHWRPWQAKLFCKCLWKWSAHHIGIMLDIVFCLCVIHLKYTTIWNLATFPLCVCVSVWGEQSCSLGPIGNGWFSDSD